MVSPSTFTELPEGSKAFVFGSVLRDARPKDFDLLVVYDQSLCPPNSAYRLHSSFLRSLEQQMGLTVDMTLLTYREEERSGFITRANAWPISKALIEIPPREFGPASSDRDVEEIRS